MAHKFSTPKTLVQQYLFIPAKHKDCYLAYVLNEFAGQSTIVFVSTCNNAQVWVVLVWCDSHADAENPDPLPPPCLALLRTGAWTIDSCKRGNRFCVQSNLGGGRLTCVWKI